MTLTAAIIASPFFAEDAPPLWLLIIANPSTEKSDTIRHEYSLDRFTEFRDEGDPIAIAQLRELAERTVGPKP